MASRDHPRLVAALRRAQDGLDADLAALDALVDHDDALLGAWARIERSRLRFNEGDYDALLIDIERARAVFAERGDEEGLGQAALAEGNVWYERAAYEQTTRSLVAARAHFERCARPDLVARARHNLGLVYWRLRELPRARTEFEAAAEVFLAEGDRAGTGNTYNSLGLIAQEDKDLVAAMRWYEDALPLLRDAGADAFVANALANIASVHEERGDALTARGFHEQALAIRTRVGHRRGQAGSRIELARVRLALGDVNAARALAADARPDAEALGLRKHLADLDAIEARIAAADGDWARAYRLEVASSAARAELANVEMARRIADLQARAEIASARREAERQEKENAVLRDANAAALAASRAKGEFIAMMSHEIRTPLTTVIGAGELLAVTQLDARQRKLVDGLVASGQALSALVDQVLDLSRIESGRLELSDLSFDLDALCAQIEAVGATAAETRGIAFSAERAVDGARRRGDPARLRQVLLNLLTNAIKFTDRGRVRLRVAADADTLAIDVEDTGIGMDPGAVAVIFQPFVQADRSTTRRFGGSGLGLAITRAIVERMGGTIDVRSRVGVGSRFRVRVPLPPAEEPALAERPVPAGPLRVLLVEDDLAVADVVTAMLRSLGHAVTRAASGLDAIDLCLAERFDTALVDVHMPVMDGVETTRRIRALPNPPRVVGLTGASAPADRARALTAGMADYLTKPVTRATLARALSSVLPPDA